MLPAARTDPAQVANRRLSPELLGVLLAAALLPYLLLAHYNSPSIHDDYRNAVLLRESGWAGYIGQLYQTWTGRYTEVILKALLLPLSYQKTALLAQVQPVVVILLLIAGGYLFLSTLLNGPPRSVVLGASVLVFLLYVGELNNAGSVLYWFGGYTAYTAGFIASFAVFTGMIGIRRYRARGARQWAYWGLAAAGAAVAVGAYEVCLMAIWWLTFSVAAYTLARRGPEWRWYAALLAVVLLFAYISASAPGNMVRAASMGESPATLGQLLRIAGEGGKCVYYALEVVPTRLNSVLLLAGTLLFAPWLARHSVIRFSGVSRSLLWLLLWLVLSTAMLVLPAVLVYRNAHHNSWQCVHFYFLIGWLMLAAAVYQWLLSRYPALASLASAPPSRAESGWWCCASAAAPATRVRATMTWLSGPPILLPAPGSA